VKKVIRVFLDLDGTIAGADDWKGYIWNTNQLFKTGLLMDMPNYSWSILTARPRIDYMFIKMVCRKYKLYPDEIITSPTWFYPFKNDEDVVNWKSSILSNYSNSFFTDSVIYVDNNLMRLSHILPQKNVILCTPLALNDVLLSLEVIENEEQL